jgi:hypothetical protein
MAIEPAIVRRSSGASGRKVCRRFSFQHAIEFERAAPRFRRLLHFLPQLGSGGRPRDACQEFGVLLGGQVRMKRYPRGSIAHKKIQTGFHANHDRCDRLSSLLPGWERTVLSRVSIKMQAHRELVTSKSLASIAPCERHQWGATGAYDALPSHLPIIYECIQSTPRKSAAGDRSARQGCVKLSVRRCPRFPRALMHNMHNPNAPKSSQTNDTQRVVALYAAQQKPCIMHKGWQVPPSKWSICGFNAAQSLMVIFGTRAVPELERQP